jgi:UDP-N-acetylmuramoyl-L-alanyl-D-glutamate--2,6-diaminopimelate ligase
MKLAGLLSGVETVAVRGDPDVEVSSVVIDSHSVRRGSLFCCLRGEHSDGHDHAPAAVEAGATALLCERDLDLPATRAIVDDTRVAMAPIAAALYGHPSHAIDVVGITGTNGKTTTAHVLAHVLTECGKPCGVLGTLSGGFTTPTTPEAPDLQAALAAERDAGQAAVALEVSSHALVRHRVDGTRFAVAVFTNLSQDHLEEHGDMESYFAAKAQLFTGHEVGIAVIGVDGEYGRRMADIAADHGLAVLPFHTADIDDAGRWRGHRFVPSLPGRHNRLNALAAASVAVALGCDERAVSVAIATAPPVPGRFQAVPGSQTFSVFVDYAHTPDALDVALGEARRLAAPKRGRVVVVVGCGGDRDRTKRPLMGRAATTGADVAVLTSDNPRSEDPSAILEQMVEGATGDAELHIEPDRAAAIRLAIGMAAPGDVVLLAGKGHETYQETNGERHHFDDREQAVDALEALGAR